jgi:cytochrome c
MILVGTAMFEKTEGLSKRALSAGLAASLMILSAGCDQKPAPVPPTPRTSDGDPARGQAAIGRYGCPVCHTIPGIEGANGLVGPPLAGIANRVYIAGVLTNTPENLIRWILNPPAVDSLTAMPYLGVGEDDARDIASFYIR